MPSLVVLDEMENVWDMQDFVPTEHHNVMHFCKVKRKDG